MIARLALMNVLAGRNAPSSLHYPFFVLVMVMACSCYAFCSVDEQLSFVQGVVVPQGLGALAGDVTFVLSLVLGAVTLLLGSHVASMRRHEMNVLSSLGLSSARIFLMAVCEQAIVLLSSLAVGVPTGMLFSHVLVFVTAGIFRGHVDGFGFFFSVRALGVTLLATLPVAVSMLVSGLLMVPRRGRTRHARDGLPASGRGVAGARLVAGISLVALSGLWLDWPGIVVLREGGERVVLAASGSPISLAILWLGTWEAMRGLGDVLVHAPGRLSGHSGRGVLKALSRMGLGRLLWAYALPLGFAVVCLAIMGYQLTGPFGSGEVTGKPFDVSSTVYLSSYASFLLCVAAGTTLSATVGFHAISSNDEYLTLYRLGLSPTDVRRSQPRRVVLDFVVPVVMAALDVLVHLAGEGFRNAPYGGDWSIRGVLLAVVLCTIVLASYLGTSLVSTRNSLRQRAAARQIRW